MLPPRSQVRKRKSYWRERKRKRGRPSRRDSIGLRLVTQNSRGTRGTHNVDGTRDLLKLECITIIMHQRSIDIYLLSETWFTGDWELEINHHGPATRTSNRGPAEGPSYSTIACSKLGLLLANLPPYNLDRLFDENTRFMGIELLFNTRSKTAQNVFLWEMFTRRTAILWRRT
jgi:hypothetical protein